MIKHLIVSLAVFSLLMACNDHSHFKIKGHVAGASGDTLYLEHLALDNTRNLDSVILSGDGSFKFKAEKPAFSPEFYQLRIKDQVIHLSIDSSETVEITADKAHFADSYTVSGSQNCALIKQLSSYASTARGTIDSLVTLRSKKLLPDSLIRQRASIALAGYKQKATQIIYSDPKTAAAYYALLQRIYDFYIFDPTSQQDIKAFGAVATAFDYYHPNHPRTKFLKDYTLQAMSALRKKRGTKLTIDDANAIGSLDIKLPDINGNLESLHALKGKVVVLCFTAYQTRFSPSLNMELGEIYSPRRAKGLEIYQVSLDDDENFWKVSASHLPWKCVRDNTGSQTVVARTYNISNLPTIFLLNKQGEIVSRVKSMAGLKAEIDRLL